MKCSVALKLKLLVAPVGQIIFPVELRIFSASLSLSKTKCGFEAIATYDHVCFFAGKPILTDR